MKKFLTALSFILVVVLLVGCGNSQANITKDLVNNTINQIDNVITTVNNLGTPNEESLKLSDNYNNLTNDSTIYRTKEPQTFTFGDKTITNNYYEKNMPNPRNMNKRYRNNLIDRNDYEDNEIVNTNNNQRQANQNQKTNSELSTISNSACMSCRDYINKKETLLQNCNNCKNELTNILDNNIVLNDTQLNSLRDYSSKLNELLNSLSSCPNCDSNINDIKDNNNSVLLSSRYKSYTDDLNTTANCFTQTNNTVFDIIRLFNQNYNLNNTTNTSTQENQNTNNEDYSVMPINEENNNSGSAYENNKRMPEAFRKNMNKIKRRVSNQKQNNEYRYSTTDLGFKPNNVRA